MTSKHPTADRPQMADYGVPVGDAAGLLDWQWAANRLTGNRNYWLVTANSTGRPHSMPVWGVWMDDDQEFWFGCAPSARKLRNIEGNPQVVVTIDDTVEVVSMEGRAERVTPGDPRLEAVIQAFVDKYFEDPDERASQRTAFAEASWTVVVPERAFGVIERPDDFGRCATRWRWD